MNFKKIFSSLFSYKPKEEYEFNLSTYPEENIKSYSYISEEKIDKWSIYRYGLFMIEML